MTDRELELRLLFAVIVAGKSAKHAEAALKRLFDGSDLRPPSTLLCEWMGLELDRRLKAARTGNYDKVSRAFSELAPDIAFGMLDLRVCSPQDLEKYHGIGPKTSRFFITWTRPNACYAVLDVHILRWLRTLGHNVPKSTPGSRQYADIERIFLSEAARLGRSPRELDAQIWAASSGHTEWSPDDQLEQARLFGQEKRNENS